MTVLESIQQNLVPFIANVGLLAILAWCLSFTGNRLKLNNSESSLSVRIMIGVSFGLAASLLMKMPVELEPGIFSDGRGAPLILSGVIGGPVSAFLTVILAGATRFHLGGIGMSAGVIYIIALGLTGVLWRMYARSKGGRPIAFMPLILVTIVATLATIPVILTMPEEKQLTILMTLWPVLLASNIFGVAAISSLITHLSRRQQAIEEMEHQRHLAQQASEAKAKFVAAISHEIRTPLNGILGILQLSERQKLPAAHLSNLRAAKESGFFLLSLINQVLDFSRIESGKITINDEVVNLDALVQGLKSMFNRQFQQKGLKLSHKIIGADECKDFGGDATHIRQALFNLIGNALKFTETSGVQLIIHIEPKGGIEERAVVTFCVEDSGVGIEDDERELILKEFHQGRAGKNSGVGTGLGLSIVDEIVNAMGGKLRIDSIPGVGSRFSFALEMSQVNPVNVFAEETDHQSSLHILIVEDNYINQMVVKGFLEQSGHQTTVAENGEEAVQLVHEMADNFDLILMDIQMPVMDGIEATTEIRKFIDGEKLPIVALTANAFVDQQEQYLTVGMQDVLTKPFKTKDLDKLLVRFGNKGTQSIGADLPPSAEIVSFDANGSEFGYRYNDQIICSVMTVIPAAQLSEMLDRLKDETDRILSAMRNSAEDQENTTRLAHELKGIAANFGLESAQAQAFNIEQRGLGTDCEEMLEELHACMYAGMEELQVRRRDLSNAMS